MQIVKMKITPETNLMFGRKRERERERERGDGMKTHMGDSPYLWR
jgi:hypothetical protein